MPPQSLASISVWRDKLGLYPVPLFPENRTPPAFVLLNGTAGNFCLDFERRVDSETRNYAWSANVGHYVAVIKDVVEVQRWDRGSRSVDRFSSRSVEEHLDEFHAYLEEDTPRRELTIISHGISVFRKLRATLGKSATGAESLEAFLYLLAYADLRGKSQEPDLGEWGLSEKSKQIAKSIRQDDWIALVEDLITGRKLEELVPELSLLIRHASGQLFQDAHYEAEFFRPSQLRMGGFLPPPVVISKPGKGIGLHFTPPVLARALVEQSLGALTNAASSIVIFDPACGSGEFLREAVRQLNLKNYRGKISLIGWDISEAACEMARFILAWEKRTTPADVSIDVRSLDSLDSKQVWPENVDLVLMNPPFLSWEDMPANIKSQVSGIVGNLSGRRPDISHAFILKAVRSLRSDGVIGTVLPASFLDSESSKPIREYLSKEFSAKLIARLGSHMLFSDATIDPAFYVAKKDGGRTNEAPLAFWADHRRSSNSAGLRALRRLQYHDQSVPQAESGFSIYPNPELGRSAETWAPREYRAWMMGQQLKDTTTVGELFDIKQGVRTGHKSAFLLLRSEWSVLPGREQKYFRPAIESESILDGKLNDGVYIFFPYGDQHIEDETHLRKVVPHFYKTQLSPAKEELLRRSMIKTAKWWELSRCTAWHKEVEPKIVSTAYGEQGSFGWDEEGKYVVVQGNGWIWRKSGKTGVLSKRLSLAYLAILNSSVFTQLLSALSRQVGGGQFDLAEQYLSRVALPNLAMKGNDNLIRELTAFGSKMHRGEAFEDRSLDELVSSAYGIGETL